MAVFEAPRGFHFSEDGARPCAHFKRVEGSRPAVYRFAKPVTRRRSTASTTCRM
jgi:hypothetical protein